MTDDAMLVGLTDGDAIAVAARARWELVAGVARMRYLDATSLAGLRAERPDWHATPLAPVTLVADPWTLDALPDRGLDCLVAFHIFADAARVREGLHAARRVLRPGGVLLIVVPDARTVAPDADLAALHAAMAAIEAAAGLPPGRDGWPMDRVVRLAASLPADWAGELELEAAWRNGDSLLAALSKGPPGGLVPGTLFQHDGRVYAIDGRRARHIQNPAVLDMLRHGGDAIRELTSATFRRIAFGPPLRMADVADYTARGGR